MLHYFFTIYEKKRQMAMLIPLLFIGSHVLHQFFTIWARRRDGNSDKYTAHRKSVSCNITFSPSKQEEDRRDGIFWQMRLYIGSLSHMTLLLHHQSQRRDGISDKCCCTNELLLGRALTQFRKMLFWHFWRWSKRGNFFLVPRCKGSLILWAFDNLSVHCIVISMIIILV